MTWSCGAGRDRPGQNERGGPAKDIGRGGRDTPGQNERGGTPKRGSRSSS